MRGLSLVLCVMVWFVLPIIGIILANIYSNPIWKLLGFMPLLLTVAITICICALIPSCTKLFNSVYRQLVR